MRLLANLEVTYHFWVRGWSWHLTAIELKDSAQKKLKTNRAKKKTVYDNEFHKLEVLR